MSKAIKIRQGLDIRVVGEAEKVVTNAPVPKVFAIKPTDFHGVTPKLVVKQGQEVKAGTPLFLDKYNDQVVFVSPVSGEIAEIVRGEKRKVLEIRVLADQTIQFEDLGSADPKNLKGEEVKAKMLASGLWPFVKQRPFDVVANYNESPKAIFISGFDSHPLAPDYDLILEGQKNEFQAGLDAIAKLTSGNTYLSVRSTSSDVLKSAQGVEIVTVEGKHPAGNVGPQIHAIDPINKGESVWTVRPQDVVIIGRLFLSGKFDASKVIALTGSEVKAPKYYKTIVGTSIESLIAGNVTEGDNRIVSGNMLTGTQVAADNFVGYYDDQVTVIPEGREELFVTNGWMSPGINKYSASKSFLSTWLQKAKKFRLDTNLKGEVRAFVVSGQYEKVFPFDIYPVHLVKSIIVNDIDGMEKLGIYEVAPEDFALCEFVCTSKIPSQSIIREGLDTIQRECT